MAKGRDVEVGLFKATTFVVDFDVGCVFSEEFYRLEELILSLILELLLNFESRCFFIVNSFLVFLHYFCHLLHFSCNLGSSVRSYFDTGFHYPQKKTKSLSD